MLVGYHHFRKPPYLSISLSLNVSTQVENVDNFATMPHGFKQVGGKFCGDFWGFSPSWSVQIGVITLFLTGWRPPCIVSIYISLKCRHSTIDLNPKVFFWLFETIRSCSSLTDVSFPMTDAWNWWKNLKSW